MTTFKVTYQGTLRRFTIATNINWFDLEFKLRTIFSIPSSLPIFLSYTDEDGDLITFSSDTELQEILAQQDNTAIFKFTLFTVDSEASENASIQDVTENIRSGVSSLQLEERQTVEPQQQMQEESRPPSYYHTTVTDDTDDVFFEKGKEKEAQGETSATASSNTTTGQEQQQESQPPFDFTEQFQLLLTQFQDVLDQNPQILETARNVVENIHRVIPADIDIWAQWLSSLRSDDNKDSDPSFYVNMTSPWHRTFYAGQYGPQGGIYHGCPRGAGFAGRCGGRPSGPPGAAEHERSKFGHARGGFGGCKRGGAGFSGCHRGGFGVPYSHRQYWEQRQRQQQNTQEKITPEQIQEKIQLLHEMGYWEDDAQNEDLLTRYNGNLERVIEILVQRQSERERVRQQQQQRQETSTDQHMEDAAKESPSPYNL